MTQTDQDIVQLIISNKVYLSDEYIKKYLKRSDEMKWHVTVTREDLDRMMKLYDSKEINQAEFINWINFAHWSEYCQSERTDGSITSDVITDLSTSFTAVPDDEYQKKYNLIKENMGNGFYD